MTSPTFYPQPAFSPNIQTTYGGFGSNQFGPLTHGFMEWDSVAAAPGYSQLATVAFQFNPSTLAASYATQTSTNAVTDYMYSYQQASATPMAGMQQSITFALLYDRTFELWGSYGSNGKSNPAFTALGGTDINNPAEAGVGVDILAMQQFTGMLDVTDSGVGNAPATPGGVTGITGGRVQFPLFFIPSWVYFGASAACLYYYGFVTDWSVQVTQWTQYMIPMRCVINVDFTLLPTPAVSGLAAGPGPTSNFWSASPLNTGQVETPGIAPAANNAGGGTAGGVRGG